MSENQFEATPSIPQPTVRHGYAPPPVEMISLRSFRLASRSGHVIQFEADKPTLVPSNLVSEAMKHGCVPRDRDTIPFYEDLEKSKTEFTGDLRRSVIWLAIDSLVRENNTKNFDGGGLPKANVISDRVGFDVTKPDVLAIYREYHSAKANGVDAPIHPQAALVQQIVDANDRNELISLLPEAGIDPKHVKGMLVRDLRKLMLAKFSGLSAA
jgi:hypothetical protein